MDIVKRSVERKQCPVSRNRMTLNLGALTWPARMKPITHVFLEAGSHTMVGDKLLRSRYSCMGEVRNKINKMST